MFSVRASSVNMRDCATFAVVGEHVTVKESATLLLFARSVDGDAGNVITPAAAFALGLGVVAGITILRRLRRR
jgi:hypothetical protein